VQNTRIDLPARARLQLIGFGVIENAVITLVPAFQASPHVVLRGPGFEAHERVRKMVVLEIVLAREVVSFRLSPPPHPLRVLVGLMHVMRDGAEVVKEFAEQVPSTLLAHHIGAQEHVADLLDGFLQQHAPAV
jgi:hypothetical protein